MTVEFEHVINAPIETVFGLSIDIDAHLASMSASSSRTGSPTSKCRARSAHSTTTNTSSTTSTASPRTDRVRFDAPLGLIGRTVERLLLARYLR